MRRYFYAGVRAKPLGEQRLTPLLSARRPSPILYHWTRIDCHATILPTLLRLWPQLVLHTEVPSAAYGRCPPGHLSPEPKHLPGLPPAVNTASSCSLETPWTSTTLLWTRPPAAAVPSESRAVIGAIHCLQCHLKFFTRATLDEHCATMHPPDTLPLQPTPCDKCHILFSSQQSIDQHRATAHGTTRFARARRHAARGGQFWCTLCSKHFINQHALDQHMVSAAHASTC